MNTVCIYVYTKTHGLDRYSYISVQVYLIMTGSLVDIHLEIYDCKLNTIEGSHCSTTENKIYRYFFFFFFFFYLF